MTAPTLPASPRAPLRALVVLGILSSALALAGASCGGSGGSRAAFTPAGPPSLVSASPSSGAAGTTVTITGLDLEEDADLETVFLGSVEATIDSASPAEIVLRVPRGLAAGTVTITVTTRKGSADSLTFDVVAGPPGAPVVTSISPEAGAPGAQVTIAGTGFGPTPAANEVTLAGRPVAIASASATAIVVVVPSDARSGALVVATPGGAYSLARTFFATSSTRPTSLGAPGDENESHVTARPFTHLLIEVDIESGTLAPQQGALDDLRDELARRLRKPGGVRVIRDATFASQAATAPTWTTTNLGQVEAQVRNHYARANCDVLHYTFVDRAYEEPTVIGITYTGSSIAVLESRLAAGGIGPSLRRIVEAAVAVHEAGHTLGLVDIGTPMVHPHEDAAGGHDVSSSCVMFASISTDRVDVINNPPPHVFDPECVLDLQAIGGK